MKHQCKEYIEIITKLNLKGIEVLLDNKYLI